MCLQLTYKLGSARMPLETHPFGACIRGSSTILSTQADQSGFLLQFQAVDVKWLGLRPTQIHALDLPRSSFKPLTQRDISAANSLARYPFVQVRHTLDFQIPM